MRSRKMTMRMKRMKRRTTTTRRRTTVERSSKPRASCVAPKDDAHDGGGYGGDGDGGGACHRRWKTRRMTRSTTRPTVLTRPTPTRSGSSRGPNHGWRLDVVISLSFQYADVVARELVWWLAMVTATETEKRSCSMTRPTTRPRPTRPRSEAQGSTGSPPPLPEMMMMMMRPRGLRLGPRDSTVQKAMASVRADLQRGTAPVLTGAPPWSRRRW